jgi:hypothetical protein
MQTAAEAAAAAASAPFRAILRGGGVPAPFTGDRQGAELDLRLLPTELGVRASREDFTRVLDAHHKAAWYGAELWVADRFYPSSKTCSACGLVNASLMLSDRTWTCPGCGTEHDRDENAGTNLARLPASRAEAQSDGKTAPVRRVAVKRVNHPGRVAA